MNTYWITFRINDDFDYSHRYESLQDTIRENAGPTWWVEPTSFIAFQSRLSTKQLAEQISYAIDPMIDVVLLTRVGFKDHVVIGTLQDADVFKLFPDLTSFSN
ncbi:MAG: hypothetical protein AAFP81_01090 [Pseudomonadota bacterium]